MKALPIVLIEGELYFEDERLKEYRSIANPGRRITFPYALHG